MITIDNVTDQMAARNLKKAVLTPDSPIRFSGGLGDSMGEAVPAAELDAILNGLMPDSYKEMYRSNGRVFFGHPCRHGQFFITIVRKPEGSQLTITRLPSIVVRLVGLLVFAAGVGMSVLQISMAHSSGRYFPAGIVLGPLVGAMGLLFLVMGPVKKDEKQALQILAAAMGVGALAGVVLLVLLNLGYV